MFAPVNNVSTPCRSTTTTTTSVCRYIRFAGRALSRDAQQATKDSLDVLLGQQEEIRAMVLSAAAGNVSFADDSSGGGNGTADGTVRAQGSLGRHARLRS